MSGIDRNDNRERSYRSEGTDNRERAFRSERNDNRERAFGSEKNDNKEKAFGSEKNDNRERAFRSERNDSRDRAFGSERINVQRDNSHTDSAERNRREKRSFERKPDIQKNADEPVKSEQPENAVSLFLNNKKFFPYKIAATVMSVLLLMWFLSSGNIMNLTKVSLSSSDRDSFFQSSSNNLLVEALTDIHNIPRTYTLGMGDYLTPKPDAAKFAKIEDDERRNYDGKPIDYYKDDTIEVKCWTEKTKYGLMTYAEVWIAHPSQFRRTIVDNVISDKHLDHPQNIFAKTNGILGMSGDYCAYRPYGIEILYGNLVRDNVGSHLTPKMDILVYDTEGNFSVYESKKDFFQTDVYKNKKIIHTLAFGPMLIDDYKVSTRKDKLYQYQNGRPWEAYPRAAICQFDYDMHYLLCRLGKKGSTLENFAKEINKKGVRIAYNLDGGQTGTIMFNKKIMNKLDYDGTRAISDIIFFATAVPED